MNDGKLAGRADPRCLRAVEFFAGVGGFALAAERVWGSAINITAVDIDQDARRVYELNHAHQMITREIESLDSSTLASFGQQLWWMSPPCQPYSRRGLQRDIQDPRAASLLYLIRQIECIRPDAIALENVEGFAISEARLLLIETLQRCNYSIIERQLCPTEMGWPNRRPRYYLLASIAALPAWQPLPKFDSSVSQLIRDLAIDPAQCAVEKAIIEQYMSAIDRVDPAKPDCVTACFGSSYGKSILRAGSYCRDENTWRRFAPTEVASLLGFPHSYCLPSDMSYRRLWKLLGNSLSIPAVHYVVSHLHI